MPRKKFEDIPYDPIAADLMREVVSGAKQDRPPPVSFITAESEEPIRAVESPMRIAEVATQIDPPRARGPEHTITKRFVLTRSENEDVEAFLLRVQKRAGTKLTLSVFARALINVAMQAEDKLLAEVGEGIPRRFPSTHDSL